MKHIPLKFSSGIRKKINEQAVEKAEKMGEQAGAGDIRNVENNLEKMKRGPIAGIWDMVQTLWKGFKSPDVPASTKVLIIGALIYLVSPFDIIPDTLGPAGLLDDAAVIAFIYAQCKDLILHTIPKVTEQIKNGMQEAGSAACEQIDRITEDAVSDTVGKMFSLFCRRMLFNSLLKLVLFTTSMMLLYFSRPGWTADKLLASGLLCFVAVWFAAALIPNIIRGIKACVQFGSRLKQVNARENQDALANPKHRKLKWQDKTAEAAYTAFADNAFTGASEKQKRFFSFMFRRWNEGKLPAWLPKKRAMVDHVWNALKFQLTAFITVFAGYLLVYNLLVKGLLMRTATDFTLWQLIAYPFVYTWHLWF
ncbi:MAG: YkvA family protein [Treponema sp.]|nr:YkvA family protein [Treponema sp.]